MTLFIKMRGEIDEFKVPATFDQFVADLNVAGATGKQYVMMINDEHQRIALNTHNILSVREVDDDYSERMFG